MAKQLMSWVWDNTIKVSAVNCDKALDMLIASDAVLYIPTILEYACWVQSTL